jgi:flagellar protein FliO/FliZ
MTSSLLLIGLFLAVLVSLPFLIERLKKRYGFAGNAGNGQSRTVSALALGPHQKVVTVEVGPADARVWLVLGVTPQAIHCLHTVPVVDSSPTIGVSPDSA